MRSHSALTSASEVTRVRPPLVLRAAAALAFGACVSASGVAKGDPQVSTALTVGGGAIRLQPGARAVSAFHLGARGDVLFLRSRDREMGIGPYVEVASEAFETFEAGGGIDWLVPITESFPLVLSAGADARHTSWTGWEPAATAALFFGSRGYNFHSVYGLTGGLFIQARRSLGDSKDTDLIGGLEVDLSFLAYPFLLVYGALK